MSVRSSASSVAVVLELARAVDLRLGAVDRVHHRVGGAATGSTSRPSTIAQVVEGEGVERVRQRPPGAPAVQLPTGITWCCRAKVKSNSCSRSRAMGHRRPPAGSTSRTRPPPPRRAPRRGASRPCRCAPARRQDSPPRSRSAAARRLCKPVGIDDAAATKDLGHVLRGAHQCSPVLSCSGQVLA